MATNASAICKFSDGSILYLRNAVTLDAAQGTELLTDASGLVNQAGGLSLGQAAQNKVMTHCSIKVQTDTAESGAFGFGAVIGVSGNVIGAVQGGGTKISELPALKSPIVMRTGVKLNVMAQAVGDAVQIASLTVYCQSGKVDIFTGTAVDATDVSMTSIISGSTLGEALVNEVGVCTMATYPATNGLADTGITDGVNALFAEDAQGQLKAMFYTQKGNDSEIVPWVNQTFRIVQNDTLTCRANV